MATTTLMDEIESPAHVRILATDDTLDGGAVLPGFQMRVDSLFDTIALAN
jgi:pantothenate kinase type III